MKKGNHISEIIRRKKRPDNKDELVITVSDGKTSAVGSLSPAELIAFLGGGIPTLIEDLIKNIDDNDGGKFMKLMILTVIEGKISDLLNDIDDDSDDDD